MSVKKLLYVGTDPSHTTYDGHLIHCPLIRIVPRPAIELLPAYQELSRFTHILFTSKNAVRLVLDHLAELEIPKEILQRIHLIAIGPVTAAYLSFQGLSSHSISDVATQEGMVAHLQQLRLTPDAYLFFPRSSLSRPLLISFLEAEEIPYQSIELYDTLTCFPDPLPDLREIDEILFTSPSTVKAFIEVFGSLPRDKKLIAIGPITEQALRLSS